MYKYATCHGNDSSPTKTPVHQAFECPCTEKTAVGLCNTSNAMEVREYHTVDERAHENGSAYLLLRWKATYPVCDLKPNTSEGLDKPKPKRRWSL
ncbi:hypothetical protein M8818_003396 [Zalaria obscura]|uniref:Uncharacterized protein n=1 Tax=Zalaria obscura TaxID=2024903 RepID=A0ACC3SFD5_9PEZI